MWFGSPITEDVTATRVGAGRHACLHLSLFFLDFYLIFFTFKWILWLHAMHIATMFEVFVKKSF